MHAHESNHHRSGRPVRSATGPRIPEHRLLELQRLVGNAAVTEMIQRARNDLVSDVLSSEGTPLAEPVRSDMEARLGADFSDVRVHTGASAARSAEAIGARAYTSGNRVVLGHDTDRHTLAHELVHVIQQREGPVSGTDHGDGMRVSDPGDRFERAAEATATQALSNPAPAETAAPPPAGDTGGTAVQRTIVYGDGEVATTRDQVMSLPEAQGLSQAQLARITAIAQDDDQLETIHDALAQTRNTVVGAIDGSGGRREGNFLAAAWRRAQNVSAYDPAMQTNILRQLLNGHHIPANTSLLNVASVVQFGAHVPHTDVLIPHPGPWVGMAPPNDLATCLEFVLGTNSHAYVLTDNEIGSAYAETLRTRLTAINTQGANTPGYHPMAVNVATVQLSDQGTASLGGTEIEVGHQPSYRIITVSR